MAKWIYKEGPKFLCYDDCKYLCWTRNTRRNRKTLRREVADLTPRFPNWAKHVAALLAPVDKRKRRSA